MLSSATYPSLQASYTKSNGNNKKSIPSLPDVRNIEKYSFIIHVDSFRDSYRSFANIPETFRDVPETFQEIPETFQDVPESFTDIPVTFQDVPETFQDVPETFRDDNKTFRDDNKTFRDNNKSTNCVNNVLKNVRVKLTDSPSALENVRITIPFTHRLVKSQGDAMIILFNKKVEAI